MSKIQDALAKVRQTISNPPADGAANIGRQYDRNSTRTIQSVTSTFRTLEGYGQYSPISEEVAEANRIICSPGYEKAIASYKILRTRVLQRLRSNNWNRLAITACGPGEGKTLTSINLAISLARQESQNVVLVDLDFVRPTVCRYLGLAPEVGLAEYFSGNATLEDIWIAPGIDRLLVLASDTPIENSSETLRSAKMLDLLEKITAKNSSSIIIFDMPPLLGSDDVLAFGPLVDALLFVVSAGKCSRADLQKAKEFLLEFEVIGTLLNRSSENAALYY